MKVINISSGSHGNAVVLDDGVSKILLDAGIPYSKLSKHVRLSEIEAVLISHEHSDHCKALNTILIRGADVIASRGTCDEIGVKIARHVYGGKLIDLSNWKIMPFDVIHDAAEPLGFIVQSKNSKKKAVYIVDSAVVEYEFSGITHWLIEANYDEDLIEQSDMHPLVKKRIKGNHMSFQDALYFFSTSDLSTAEEIHLLHLSNAHSDETAFVKQLEKQTGIPVYT